MILAKSRAPVKLFILAMVFGLAPVSTCTAGATSPEGNRKALNLLGTHWKLFELDGRSVGLSGFESSFTLGPTERGLDNSSGQIVNATPDGCNELKGVYATDGEVLHFKPVSTTLVVCRRKLPSAPPGSPFPEGTLSPGHEYTVKNNQAELFIKALNDTSHFEIHGATLSLINNHGAVVARLEGIGPN